MEVQKLIVFNGVKYRLMGAKRYYLSQSTTNKGRKGAKGLHVAIWEFYSGKTVPKGYVVHHKDGNHFNNDFSNLECISRNEHIKKHIEHLSECGRTPEKIKQLSEIRELSKKWHASEEGKKWHSENAKKAMAKKRHKQICTECGQEYETCGQGTICRKCQNRLSQRKLRKKRKSI